MKLEDSLPSYKLQVTAFLCINYIIDRVWKGFLGVQICPPS